MSIASDPFALFTEIRKDARFVAEHAAHVGVLTKKADLFAAEYTPAPAVTLPSGVDADHALDFLLLRSALRFGSGYEPRLTLKPRETAAENLDEALVRRFSASGPIPARDMVHATAKQVAELRGQGLVDAPQAEFAEFQVRALRDLGRFLLDRYQGSSDHLLESVQGSAADLCDALATIPYFHDVQRYRGVEVHFFHRAQRLILDLTDIAGDAFGQFDLAQLAPSSDAECALALHAAGVVMHDKSLGDRIANGEIVPAHSEREVELRAATLHAVERVTTTLRATQPDVTAADVDRWLRVRAREARRAGRQPHRTRSVFY